MGHSRLYSNCKGAASEYSAVASLVISLRSLNLIGIALALALYLCRENHLYHLAPYATIRVKVILTKFLYAVSRSSCFPSILARVTSA